MEVGWYLRFARTDTVQATVSVKGADQVRHQETIFPDWSFSYDEHNDHVVAVMTRNKPVYSGGTS